MHAVCDDAVPRMSSTGQHTHVQLVLAAAWHWTALVFFHSSGVISQLNTYSSRLLQKILILKNHPHSGWYLQPNRGAFIRGDNGLFQPG